MNRLISLGSISGSTKNGKQAVLPDNGIASKVCSQSPSIQCYKTVTDPETVRTGGTQNCPVVGDICV